MGAGISALTVAFHLHGPFSCCQRGGMKSGEGQTDVPAATSTTPTVTKPTTPTHDDLLNSIHNCQKIDDFLDVYNSKSFKDALGRIGVAQGSRNKEEWAKEWAIKRRYGDSEADSLNKDRQVCLELLYKMCDCWKDPKYPTVTKEDITESFGGVRVSNILGRCVVMDRAQALYKIQVGGSGEYGAHWFAEQHAEKLPEWEKIAENYEGYPTMNRRFLWLLDINELKLGANKSLLKWLEPQKATR